MWDRLSPGPQYEQLSQAIIQAILSSKEVQDLVSDLLERGALNADDIVAVALRFPPHGGLEARVELIRKSSAERTDGSAGEEAAEVEDEAPASRTGTGREPAGEWRKQLTPNEIAFEKYLQDRFDEEAWMRRVRIRFLPENEKISLSEGKTPGKSAE